MTMTPGQGFRDNCYGAISDTSIDLHGSNAGQRPVEEFALQFLDMELSLLYNTANQEAAETISPRELQPTAAPLKIGTRFSSESVKVLRGWFVNHQHHPYPTVEDILDLQDQTGLSRQQVTNWFTNARRRSKVHSPRPVSPLFQSADEMHFTGHQTPIDTPRRRPTPAPFEHMDPLQRWENSPPEHEAAAVRDISRAVAAFSGGTLRPGHSLRTRSNHSSLSSRGSSVSSRDSGSCSSANSYPSRRSSGSFDILQKRRHRRWRTKAKRQETMRSTLLQVQDTYQCTFCTETFKTKYDWQRHEKSLHLSLENWQCSPDGPTAVHPEDGLLCVFCGEKNPDKTHLDGHNQSACIERPLEERTYYRKDHLQQHLRLVHASKFMKWPMDRWKVITQEIRSRCGFCGAALTTWNDRVDHLAGHFKAGITMEDWKGDWGFEAHVVDRIDNAMPPYLIHYERNSPLPFAATKGPPDTPTSAYELIKLELEYYMQNYYHTRGGLPLDSELQYEGCSVILGAEIISINPASSAPSWLWDVFMSSTEIANQARLRPTKQLAESRLSQLKINGKGNIFENCELELSMRQYIEAQASIGHLPADPELQQETCNILSRIERSSPNPSRRFLDFLVRLVWSSTTWLLPIRQRVPTTIACEESPSIMALNPMVLPSSNTQWSGDSEYRNTMSNSVSLQEVEMAVGHQTTGNCPWISLADITHTPSDEISQQSQPQAMTGLGNQLQSHSTDFGQTLPNMATLDLDNTIQASVAMTRLPQHPGMTQSRSVAFDKTRTSTPFFLNDNNSYRRLKRELSRFVMTTMSPNNPNSHIPSDEELKYQARWILYDDDDPWNQTPVDNAEWLREFKRDVGLATIEDTDSTAGSRRGL